MILGVKGNSGCKINILDDKIIKATTDSDGNSRLKIQCEKQSSFKSNIFKAPSVYESGINEKGNYFFIMEYIRYKTFDKIFNTATKNYLDLVVEKLVSFVIGNINHDINVNVIVNDVDRNILLSKYETTKNNIRVQKNIDISYLDRIFYSLESTLRIPIGYCHGDLTFSNLLFEGDDIIVLDFLDTYLDSPLQDIVKIRQDTKYYWSTRMLDSKFDKIKLEQCLNYIDKKIHHEFSKYDFYNKYYNVFQIMNLLRIVPYCDNDNNVKFLMSKIDKLCQH